MRIPAALHSWKVTPRVAAEIQRNLAPRIITRGRLRKWRIVAGADLAFTDNRQTCIAGVVVWDAISEEVVESHVLSRPVRFPYVPGLLSFREAPAIIAVLRKIKSEPDVFMFDGQGLAHPRRFGLACHVGLQLDRPSIGCAKSVLIGNPDEPGSERGSVSLLHDREQDIGMALRTRKGVKPVYISIGHKLSLQTAVDVALQCTTRYRLPEPTRLADKLVAQAKLEGIKSKRRN